MRRHQLLRAIGTGLAVFITGLLIYDRPPEIGAFWQPGLQAALAALSALGVNAAVRPRR